MELSLSWHESVTDCAHRDVYETIIRRVTDAVAETYGIEPEEELSVLLCDNQYIHELNLQYRQIDRPTDVLSFALNEGMVEGEAETPSSHLLGDLIISLDKAAEQGEAYGHGMERELAYLTVHGCLHILGYDHMTPEDKAEMREEEEYILGKLQYLREGVYHE